MNWWGLVIDGVSKIPWERIVIRPKVRPMPQFSIPRTVTTETPQKEPEIASQSEVATSTPSLEETEGTACLPCTQDHLSTCSGLLAEALRFARKDGIQSREVISRIGLCNDELNAMERVDLRPELTMKLPEWEKEIADTALKGSRDLRHDIANMTSVGNLESVAGKAQTLRGNIGKQWMKGRMANMSQGDKERVKEKAQELLDKELQTGGE